MVVVLIVLVQLIIMFKRINRLKITINTKIIFLFYFFFFIIF